MLCDWSYHAVGILDKDKGWRQVYIVGFKGLIKLYVVLLCICKVVHLCKASIDIVFQRATVLDNLGYIA